MTGGNPFFTSKSEVAFFQPLNKHKSPSAMKSSRIYLVLNSTYLQLRELRVRDFRVLNIHMVERIKISQCSNLYIYIENEMKLYERK